MKVLKQMIVLPKRNTSENLESINPILRYKELCCELTETGERKWKLGDGKTCFNDLPYVTKISEIEELLLYDSTLTASTDPVFCTTRTTRIYLNPFKYTEKTSE